MPKHSWNFFSSKFSFNLFWETCLFKLMISSLETNISKKRLKYLGGRHPPSILAMIVWLCVTIKWPMQTICVFQGPINNILLNGRESMRVMSCTASLSFNHTVERFKLMFKPVKEIVYDFVVSFSHLFLLYHVWNLFFLSCNLEKKCFLFRELEIK